MKTVDEIIEANDINWLVNLVDDRKNFADACRKCSECDIFDKCQKEGLRCEKDEENIMKENNENDLISRRALYEKCVELEQEALKMVLTTDDETERLIWNAVLTERSAFKFSVMDAQASLSNPSTKQKPKKGQWIVHDYAFGKERYECSECGGRCNLKYDYCPNCASEMR